MRIGVFVGKIQEPTEGGGSTYQYSIINQLKQTRSNHSFYILYDNKKNIFQNNQNLKFINLGFKKRRFFKRKLYSKEISLNSEVLKNKIELVWFLCPNYQFVETPFILTVWDLQHRLQPYFPEVSLSGWIFEDREKFYDTAIPRASYVIIGNQEGARQVEKFYNFPIERIKTIPLPTPQFVYEKKEDNRILSKNNLTKNNYLFYPAQFWPHKNHIRIIKALNILRDQQFNNLNIVFTGADKGNKEYIKQKVKEYNLKDRVKFLGFVSESELISLYKNAFAMVFPSMFGPDNLPPLEAMALNCPVICSNAKGMEEQLGNAALFFKATDENDLAEKIKQLAKDQELKETLIKNGQELAAKLTTENYIKKLLELVEEFSSIRECWSSTDKFIHL